MNTLQNLVKFFLIIGIFAAGNAAAGVSTSDMLNMTAAEFTDYLKSEKELSADDKVVDGVGGVVLYKIGNDYYQVSGPRAGELMLGNGGKVAPDEKLINQLRAEFEEETFGVLPLSADAKPLDSYFVDPQNWGTFATFTFLDESSFSSKEELEAAVNNMNPTANFYNAIFNYVVGTVRGWNKSELSEQEHQQKRLEIANQYKELKENGKLLVDILDDKFFEKLDQLPVSGKAEKWWETPNTKLTTEYKIGEYSERPSYKLYSLSSLVQLTKDGTEFFNNAAAKNLLPKLENLFLQEK